ncbi:hypothetical protein BDV23DRAFT_185484 [Aspergillus alliaceus]|uniref:Uncharacterized protein n=1 Tax=Petromyces alliaceus TaxID=209559 RepID=A0A5N6FW54_PETAA|nr:uncharacterized protein BDW43DRAFT_311150 [Aspergillus alliaceus]KAB8233435.1 hypothetical protein BDW43DRAFT_311150 [Aspergillus alliaceus]KAE8388267.1 hypothetical protein BDV23DRAFT_185484 [Aspergillus alliaceus]
MKQETVLFIDLTNDILSYYKERFINEKGDFMTNFGEAHQVERLDVLRHLTFYTPQVLPSVDKMLEGKEDLKKPLEQFITGWVMLATAHRC